MSEGEMRDSNEVFAISDGRVRTWIDQGAIHLTAIDRHQDPVELTSDDARQLAAKLIELADILDR